MTALAGVNDPEIGRPITELGMVKSVEIGSDGAVAVGVLVLLIAHWNALEALAQASPDAQQDWVLSVMLAGPVLALVLSLFTTLAASAATMPNASGKVLGAKQGKHQHGRE